MRSFIAKRSLMLTTMLILSQAAGAQGVTGNVDAQMFRSIFSNLVDSKGTDQNRIDHLIYAPVPELLSGSDLNFAKSGVNCQVTGPLSEMYARKSLCAMQKDYSASTAATFYQQGQSTGKLEVDLAALTRNLQQQDLLIVVVPGIFGEFIKGRAFEEVFEKDTAYGRQFHAALEKQTRAQLGAGDCASISQDVSVCDKQEQLKRLSLVNETGSQQVPMGEL
ncbi:MAG: hypothetical protein ACXWQE_12530, partial [Bdellovibrionales bacterium]